MARYEEYTAKQQNEMNRLAARATRYKMKIDEVNKKLAEPVISFEDNLKLREMLKMFKDLYQKATDEIKVVMEQKNIYSNHLKEAKVHIDAAEELKKKWGF